MNQKLQNLFFLFLLGTIGAKAQGPVITAAGVNPVIGESFRWQYVLQSSVTPPTPGGPDVLWDYSNLKDSSINELINFISPNGLPWADSLHANIARTSSLSANYYIFYNTNDSSWGYVGASGTGNYYNHVTPSQLFAAYPLTFRSTYTDSVLVYIQNSIPDHIERDTLFADSYGILKLPDTTYTNVVRVVYKNIASSYPSNIPYGIFTQYQFFVNGIHSPILTLNQDGSNWDAEYNTRPTTLPLQISSFTASWQNKMPYLQWEAANTENTKAFNIQRSVDGHSFSTVGRVGVSGGSSYHFEDNYIPTSTVYYRLQQVDKNGQTFSSATAQLTVNSKQLTVYPNPSKGTIHVSVNGLTPVHIMIYDAIGRLVYENKNYSAAQSIATDTWSKGTYLVRVKDNEGWKDSSFVIN